MGKECARMTYNDYMDFITRLGDIGEKELLKIGKVEVFDEHTGKVVKIIEIKEPK